MYYIGEVLYGDLNINGNPIVELWDDACYCYKIDAEKRLKKLKINIQVFKLLTIKNMMYICHIRG